MLKIIFSTFNFPLLYFEFEIVFIEFIALVDYSYSIYEYFLIHRI